MLTTEFSVPVSVEVSISDLIQGIFEIEGLLNFAGEKLTIEYQPKELLSRTAPVETVELSLDALREVSIKRRVGATITLRPKRLSTFTDVPIAKNAQIALKVKRADRKQAEALVSHVQRVMSYRSAPDTPVRIPFKASDVGLREVKGELYLEDHEFLVLELQNALVGEFDTRQHIIKVAPRALAEVRLVERRRRDRLYIRPKQRELLDAMPGSHKDELELKTDRKYRDQIERLIYELARLSSANPAPTEGPTGGSEGVDE